MRLDEMSEQTNTGDNTCHRCTRCGDIKPLAEFIKWRSGRVGDSWYCGKTRRGRGGVIPAAPFGARIVSLLAKSVCI